MMFFGRNAVLVDEEIDRALRHLQLALAREGLGLQLVFVDGPDDQRRAILLRDGTEALELLLAILEVDGIDDALALAVSKRKLDGARIGGVDHDRRLDDADQLFVKKRDIRHLVAVGALQADVDDVRAVLHLAARDLDGLLPFLFRDQILEKPRADDVGALADDQRTVAVFGFDQFDAGVISAMRRRLHFARLFAFDHLRDGGDVFIRGAAASADDIEPAVVGEALELIRERGRGFEIEPLLVRAARHSGSRRCASKPCRKGCGCGPS